MTTSRSGAGGRPRLYRGTHSPSWTPAGAVRFWGRRGRIPRWTGESWRSGPMQHPRTSGMAREPLAPGSGPERFGRPLTAGL